jgi:hypothetical protein
MYIIVDIIAGFDGNTFYWSKTTNGWGITNSYITIMSRAWKFNTKEEAENGIAALNDKDKLGSMIIHVDELGVLLAERKLSAT